MYAESLYYVEIGNFKHLLPTDYTRDKSLRSLKLPHTFITQKIILINIHEP